MSPPTRPLRELSTAASPRPPVRDGDDRTVGARRGGAEFVEPLHRPCGCRRTRAGAAQAASRRAAGAAAVPDRASPAARRHADADAAAQEAAHASPPRRHRDDRAACDRAALRDQTLRRSRAAVRPAPFGLRVVRGSAVRHRIRARRQSIRVACGRHARSLDRRVRRRSAGGQELAGGPARVVSGAPGCVGRPRRAIDRRRCPCAIPDERMDRADVRSVCAARAALRGPARRGELSAQAMVAGPLVSSLPSGSRVAALHPFFPPGRTRRRSSMASTRSGATRRSPVVSISRNYGIFSPARTLLVAPDTGVAHLGRIVGVPTVTLFGPGSAVLCGAGDFWCDAPYRAVTIEPFACRDQRVLFKREIPWVRRCGRSVAACPRHLCMPAIGVDAVQNAILSLDPLRQ